MKLDKREKILAMAFGASIALLLMQRLAFLPFSEKLDIVDTEIGTLEKKVSRALYIRSQKEKITEYYDKLKPYIELGETEEDFQSTIIKKIEEFAKDSEVSLLNMKPDTVANEDETQSICTIEISIESSQTNIIRFLYKMENSNYPISIKKLDFKIKDREANLMEAGLDVEFVRFL